MNILNQINVALEEVLSGNLVWMPKVVSAHLNNDKVRGLFGRHVPFFRLGAVKGGCARTRVRCAVPIPDL